MVSSSLKCKIEHTNPTTCWTFNMHLYNTYILWTHTCTPTLTCTFSLTKRTVIHDTYGRRRWFKSGCKAPSSIHCLYKRLPLREATGPDQRLQSPSIPGSVLVVLTLFTPAPSSVSQLAVKIVLVIVSFSGENVCTYTRERAQKEVSRPHTEEQLDKL